jgi:hypothetical protein
LEALSSWDAVEHSLVVGIEGCIVFASDASVESALRSLGRCVHRSGSYAHTNCSLGLAQSTALRTKEASLLKTYFLLAATLVFWFSPCRGQTRNTVVATIDLSQAILDSNEGKHEMAAIRTKVPQERQQKMNQIAQGILAKMAPLIVKFAGDNGLGVIIDATPQTPKAPVLWSKQHGADSLRKQVDITKLIVDSYNGSLAHLPTVTGDQSVVLIIDSEQAIINTEEGKRELAAIGDNVTPEQKQKISSGILAKMAPWIAKFAADGGADLVIDSSPPWPNGSVLWCDQRFNITERVVSAYNGR